jgi:hypothetical protein
MGHAEERYLHKLVALTSVLGYEQLVAKDCLPPEVTFRPWLKWPLTLRGYSDFQYPRQMMTVILLYNINN